MKFTFELDDDYFDDSRDFAFEVKESAIQACVDRLMKEEATDGYYSSSRIAVGEILKQNKQEIIDGIIKMVADNVCKKNEIASLMPKASEINQINRENQKYFEELIEKAIAKKFK